MVKIIGYKTKIYVLSSAPCICIVKLLLQHVDQETFGDAGVYPKIHKNALDMRHSNDQWA